MNALKAVMMRKGEGARLQETIKAVQESPHRQIFFSLRLNRCPFSRCTAREVLRCCQTQANCLSLICDIIRLQELRKVKKKIVLAGRLGI